MSEWKGMKPDDLPQPKEDATCEFAHGFSYGDVDGVVFYGPPDRGFWNDLLAISDIYMGPIFYAMLSKGASAAPRVASEWNAGTGWENAGRKVELSREYVEEFLAALAQLTPGDLAAHCQGKWLQDCMRCSAAIHKFLSNRLASGASIFIEDE